jgi:hypothetical protein
MEFVLVKEQRFVSLFKDCERKIKNEGGRGSEYEHNILSDVHHSEKDAQKDVCHRLVTRGCVTSGSCWSHLISR